MDAMIERYIIFFLSSVLLLGRETIGEGLYEGELIGYLRDNYKTSNTLSYNDARDAMYSDFDNFNGVVYGIYTNFSVSNVPEFDPRPTVHEGGLNCEHIWPQSKYEGSLPMKSDLHHLRPSKENVNSSRGNKPFGENPDSQTNTWFWMSQSQSSIPSSNIDEYSESGTNYFEPREDRKGDIARSVFYFYTMYSEVSDGYFFDEQKEILKVWHEQDPVDEEETSRTSGDEDRPTPRQRWLLKNRSNVFPILFVVEGIALLVVLANWFIGLIPFGASAEGDRFTLIFWRFIGKTLGLVEGDTTSPGGLNIESLSLLILILFAIGGTIYLRKQVMAWHIRFRRKRPKEDGDENIVSEKSESSEQEETDSSEEKEEQEEDEDDDDIDEDHDDDEEYDEEEDDEYDDEEEDDGAVDIGSYVGVDDEDGEFFGTIVEFLDDDDEVVVEREDDGKEITVPFDLIFLGDE